MTMDGESAELSWEMDGADRLVIRGKSGNNLSMIIKINSDGNLSDDLGMGAVPRKK